MENFKTDEANQQINYYDKKIKQQKSEYVIKQEESKGLSVYYDII